MSAGVPSINSIDNGGTGLDIGDTVTFRSQVGGVDGAMILCLGSIQLGVTSTSTVGTSMPLIVQRIKILI